MLLDLWSCGVFFLGSYATSTLFESYAFFAYVNPNCCTGCTIFRSSFSRPKTGRKKEDGTSLYFRFIPKTIEGKPCLYFHFQTIDSVMLIQSWTIPVGETYAWPSRVHPGVQWFCPVGEGFSIHPRVLWFCPRSVGEGFGVKYRRVSCVQSIICTCGTGILSPSSSLICRCALVTL